ncbi:MAG: ATP-binding cassette domain-containing protein [Kiritimatiellae bacterium]|nr:ATP-binding cassette domain-containing protein [Kiritimatiellia bacterium]
MIKVENITKCFGRTTALNNISFSVKRGEIVGFLGPNGAGKTTMMRMLTCFLPPTGGQISIGGVDVFKDSLAVRRMIGYMPENVPLYLDMRVEEYLRYRARLKGVRGKRLVRQLDDVITRCGLTGAERRIIGQLSKGYRQRVGLADSLIHEPELLILDEPTIGLDPNQIRHIRNLIRSLAQRHTVLLSSHILPEVEAICERVLIVNRGQIVASDTPDNLLGLLKGNFQVRVEVLGSRDEIIDKLESIDGILKVSWEPTGEWHRFTCESKSGQDIRADIFKAVSGSGWVLRELSVKKKNLEDVFVEITHQGIVRDSGEG